VLYMLYDITLSEPFTSFQYDHVTVTVWQWCHTNPIPKSPKINIKEIKIKNEKNKIVRVHHLELWHILDYGIIYYINSKLDYYGYIDSDFGGNKNTKRSTKENIFFRANRPMFWETKH